MSEVDAATWLFLAVITALIARMKGRGALGYFVSGLLFGPFALLFAIGAEPKLDVLYARLAKIAEKQSVRRSSADIPQPDIVR